MNQLNPNSLASLLGETSIDAQGLDERPELVPYVYRHKKIAFFATGEDNPSRGLYRFEFRNHVLTITGATQEEIELKNKVFLELAKGLMGVDKLNIEWIRQRETTYSLDDARERVVRGPVGTHNVADKAAIPDAASGDDSITAVAKPATPAPAKPGFSFAPRT